MMISSWNTNNITAAASWHQQYKAVGTAENSSTQASTTTSTTTTTTSNPEWEKAREALAKISVDTMQDNSEKKTPSMESTNGANPQSGGQQAAYQPYYQHYYQHCYPTGVYQGTSYQHPYGFLPGYSSTPYHQMGPMIPQPLYPPYGVSQSGYAPPTPTSSDTSLPDTVRNENSTTAGPPNTSHELTKNNFNQSGHLQHKFQLPQSREKKGSEPSQQIGTQAGDKSLPLRQNSNAERSKINNYNTRPFWNQFKPNRATSFGTPDTNTEFPNKKFRPAFQRSWSSPTKSEENQSDAELSLNNNNNLKPNFRSNSRVEKGSTESKNHSGQVNNQNANKSSAQIKGDQVSAQEWPPSLRDYVQRAFEKCQNEKDKDATESFLKHTLTASFKDGSAWTTDWDKEPLPCSLQTSSLRQERNQAGQWQSSRRRSSPVWRRRTHSRSRSRSRTRSRSNSSSPDARKSFEGRRKKGGKKSQNRKAKTPVKGNKSSKNTNSKKKNQGLGYRFEDTPEDREKMQKRAQRFHSLASRLGPRNTPSIISTINASLIAAAEDEEEMDWSQYHVVGNCQELEKRYYRLTTAPDPSTVRPLEVLKKSLSMVTDHWKSNLDYKYACEQLKSIRQDLTVQGIRDEFTVMVYEIHARIALEKGDREEFNQCQTQLKALYAEGLKGNKNEFTAYRILYFVFTNNTLDQTTVLAHLTKEEKSDTAIQHALLIRSAWALSNYHTFFQLYLTAPNMSGYLLDMFVQRQRNEALRAVVKSYRPHLPVSFIQSELGFTAADDPESECRKFLQDSGVVLTEDGTKVDCKQSQSVLGAS